MKLIIDARNEGVNEGITVDAKCKTLVVNAIRSNVLIDRKGKKEMNNMVNILMLGDAKGAVGDGLHVMPFEKGNYFKIDISLANAFFKKGFAVLADTVPPEGPYIMHIEDIPASAFSYGIPKHDPQPFWKRVPEVENE